MSAGCTGNARGAAKRPRKIHRKSRNRLRYDLCNECNNVNRTGEPMTTTTTAYERSVIRETTVARDWTVEERRMKSWDGGELFYRVRKPTLPAQKALVLFHRGH